MLDAILGTHTLGIREESSLSWEDREHSQEEAAQDRELQVGYNPTSDRQKTESTISGIRGFPHRKHKSKRGSFIPWGGTGRRMRVGEE